MKVQNISKDRKVLVELSSDDLTIICNALYSQSKEEGEVNSIFQLCSDMLIVNDLCKYGHIDNFCLEKIVECRNRIKKIRRI